MKTEPKTIGLIGGITWGATAEYYRLLNSGIADRLGDRHSAELLIRSFDFQPLLERVDDTAGLEDLFEETGCALATAGASLLGIASFTGHRYAARLRCAALPFVDLADAVAAKLAAAGPRRVAVWATSYALSDDALLDRLAPGDDVLLLPPPEECHARLDDIAFTGLADRHANDDVRAFLSGLIAKQAADQGADALLLATTDFAPFAPMLDTDLRIFDAADIHCGALLNAALAPDSDAA